MIAVLAGDVFDVAAHSEMLTGSTAMRDWMASHGSGGGDGKFALHTRLHSETVDATTEEFDLLHVAQRYNAIGNPNALLRTPMSMRDYLTARPIADPLRLYDCVMHCAGAHGDCPFRSRSQATDPGVKFFAIFSPDPHRDQRRRDRS